MAECDDVAADNDDGRYDGESL
jgi:hypothetical protein